MKKYLKKILAFGLSLAMIAGSAAAVYADDIDGNHDDEVMPISTESSLSAGTYTVPVSLDDTVSAMGVDFGAMLDDYATAVINEDGTVTFTLSFSTGEVMGYTAWIGDFYGYYEDDTLVTTDLATTTTTITDENGDSQTAVDTAVFTASSVEDTYDIGYYLSSNMMNFTRQKTMTVDWDNAEEGIVEHEDSSSAVSYSSTATVDGYYYDLTVDFTVEDGVITSVTVSSEELYNGEHDDSQVYYDYAVLILESSLLGVSATADGLSGVDTVSGATMTSDAIINAIISALGLDESNDAEVTLEAEATYSVDITFKAAAHSLVSDPTATANDDTDTVSAVITTDENANPTLAIDIYNSEEMYITAFNGLHAGGMTDGDLSMDGIEVTTEESTEVSGGSIVTGVTIPLDGLYKKYYTSVSVYVPSMSAVDMDGDGEADNGYFDVDPSTVTIDWDTLTKTEDSTSDTGSGDDTLNNDSGSSGTVLSKQTITVRKKVTKTFKAKKLKSKKQSFQISAKAKGKLTYKVIGGTKKAKKAVKVSKTGKVTVKKGTKKGTYTVKVKVSAAKTAKYKAASKTIKVTVKVK